MNAADAPVSHEFASKSKLTPGSLPGSRLPHTPISLYRVANGFTFREVLRKRLLAVHILACAGRRDSEQTVPVIRCRDHHCIDIGPREQVLEMLVSLAILVLVFLVDRRAPGLQM